MITFAETMLESMKKVIILGFLLGTSLGTFADDKETAGPETAINPIENLNTDDSNTVIETADSLSMTVAEEETEPGDELVETESGNGGSMSTDLTLKYIPAYRRMAISPGATNFKLSPTETQPSYKFFDDISWAGVPVFVAGIIAKSEKHAFRQDYRNPHVNTRLVTHFKTSIDDKLQFFSPALTLGLKIGGVEGRSDLTRLLTSAAMSYGLMAGFVNSIKYTASELRPDGSTHNAWPSGHTATAFVGATILHKEYGLTRSPWYSVLGYSMATATGVMRVLNNRHWVSDVLSGAGIGIMSGELAYALSDLIFKDRHLLRGDLMVHPDLNRDHPSFFDVSMGMGFGSKDISFDDFDIIEGGSGKDLKLKFRTATVVQAEGAYFINKYIGIGGRLRVRTSPINGWNDFLQLAENDIEQTINSMGDMDDDGSVPEIAEAMSGMITDKEISIESDHLTEFAGDAGLYFNIPLSDRFALGTKLLVGHSVMQALDINARFKGEVKDMDYDMTIVNGIVEDLNINNITSTGETYDVEWDYLTVEGNNTVKYGTGISLTYTYKGNFCWKIFCDFDFTRKTYTLTYDPDSYLEVAFPRFNNLCNILTDENDIDGWVYKTKKNMFTWVLGASFSVSF